MLNFLLSLSWLDYLAGAIVAIVLVNIPHFVKTCINILNPKNRKLFGKWYRYGRGFLSNEPSIVEYEIKISWGFTGIKCKQKNKRYKYVGKLEKIDGSIFIQWKGMGHKEKMLSIYKNPIQIFENTALIGVKCCITQNKRPAANAELLTKIKISHQKANSLLKQYENIVISEPDTKLSKDK